MHLASFHHIFKWITVTSPPKLFTPAKRGEVTLSVLDTSPPQDSHFTPDGKVISPPKPWG